MLVRQIGARDSITATSLLTIVQTAVLIHAVAVIAGFIAIGTWFQVLSNQPISTSG
tara:strand:+ start:828 stop:995 length:168 start_codon:yes stop_codon:yes gene_type:complete